MLFAIAESEGIDLAGSYLIGDSWRDIQAGQLAGCRTILLRRPYNAGVEAHNVAETLMEAIDLILGELSNAKPHGVLRQ